MTLLEAFRFWTRSSSDTHPSLIYHHDGTCEILAGKRRQCMKEALNAVGSLDTVQQPQRDDARMGQWEGDDIGEAEIVSDDRLLVCLAYAKTSVSG